MKRKRRSRRGSPATKRQRTDNSNNEPPTWPLLRQYYPKVLTLRQYLASRVSRKRRWKLLHYEENASTLSETSIDVAVVSLLDSTVVGTFNHPEASDVEAIDKDITVFTQQLSESIATVTATQGALKQPEIVDFTIWALFRKHYGPFPPSHMLCRGYQKHATTSDNGPELVAVPGVPGVSSNCTNPHVQTLKAFPWCVLPSLLGSNAEKIISDMLIRHGLFQSVENSSNLIQLSGVPLCDLNTSTTTASRPQILSEDSGQTSVPRPFVNPSSKRGLSEIQFVRHRMLYARPALTATGNVSFGLARDHVLNRNDAVENHEQTVHVIKYILPRQFGLHNVFTSSTDLKDTTQPFKDYTFRDEEIAHATYRWRQRQTTNEEVTPEREPPLPKRLRSDAIHLIARLRKRHKTRSYGSLLNYYCPKQSDNSTSSMESIDHASSLAQVSAFCRNVISRVFPRDFWGCEETGSCNERTIFRNVDRFIRLRRYESLSLHNVIQDLRIRNVKWLEPSRVDAASGLSLSDFAKRTELIAELLYYLFDSFLIPLIRGHFHVTESGAHRNQLFYFRHDVWKSISEPALTSLKSCTLEECNTAQVKQKLARRALGVSQVRLLPKAQGMRPIINLRRRVQKLQHGRLVLGKSINSILTPAFSILNYEKGNRPEILGSAMFSVEDMYPRLQAFRKALKQQGVAEKPLYFAKVDVKACFDTIPQKRLMRLARSILDADAYNIAKYARSKLVGGHNDETPEFGTRPSWRYLTKATVGNTSFDFRGEVETDTANGRTRTVFVNGVLQKREERKAVLDLLEEHVESNLIKLGNRFYRQKEGIPQGSIVSSLLCSYFYAELERNVLGFVNDGQSVLLRLIDDFLVISTNRHVAQRFIREMHRGVPEFGVDVKADKSRVNFDLEIDGKAIERLPGQTDFPYCGNAINTVTLNLSKDKERRKQSNIPDSMSVEYSRLPGETFYRKTLNALKLQMHAMLFSTAYNKLDTVLSNLHHAFTEVAQKSYHYIRSLSASKQPPGELVIKTVNDLIKLACVLLKRGKRSSRDVLPYKCCVSNAQTRWLACTAFHTVFQRRQTKHTILLEWLGQQLAAPALRAHSRELAKVVREDH